MVREALGYSFPARTGRRGVRVESKRPRFDTASSRIGTMEYMLKKTGEQWKARAVRQVTGHQQGYR
jgi:hypothetical protein